MLHVSQNACNRTYNKMQSEEALTFTFVVDEATIREDLDAQRAVVADAVKKRHRLEQCLGAMKWARSEMMFGPELPPPPGPFVRQYIEVQRLQEAGLPVEELRGVQIAPIEHQAVPAVQVGYPAPLRLQLPVAELPPTVSCCPQLPSPEDLSLEMAPAGTPSVPQLERPLELRADEYFQVGRYASSPPPYVVSLFSVSLVRANKLVLSPFATRPKSCKRSRLQLDIKQGTTTS